MRTARHAALLLVLAAALAAGACASTGSGSSGAEFAVPIEIDNNALRGGVTVYITRSTGTGRRLLGPVEAGQKRSFTHDAYTGNYMLTARSAGSPDINSESFQLQPGARVTWILGQNRLLMSMPEN